MQARSRSGIEGIATQNVRSMLAGHTSDAQPSAMLLDGQLTTPTLVLSKKETSHDQGLTSEAHVDRARNIPVRLMRHRRNTQVGSARFANGDELGRSFHPIPTSMPQRFPVRDGASFTGWQCLLMITCFGRPSKQGGLVRAVIGPLGRCRPRQVVTDRHEAQMGIFIIVVL